MAMDRAMRTKGISSGRWFMTRWWSAGARMWGSFLRGIWWVRGWIISRPFLFLTQASSGSAPLPKAGVAAPVVDVYLADAWGLYHTPPVPQGRTYLASYAMDGPSNINPVPGLFSFDTSALNLTAEELARVTVTANYSLTN